MRAERKIMIVTDELLGHGKSDRGGLNRKQFEILGVAWPPPRDWKKSIVGILEITEKKAEQFVKLNGKNTSCR